MKKFKEYAAPTIVLFVICVVAAFLLAVTNKVTAPAIADVNAQNEAKARAVVFTDAASFGEAVKTDAPCVDSVVPALDASGNTIGYVVTSYDEKGYGGRISIMTGVDSEGKVTGVSILDMSETAGLGANAKRDSFREQFIGKIKGITVSKDEAGENAIDALTGATVTSRAVTRAVNAAIEAAGGVNNG